MIDNLTYELEFEGKRDKLQIDAISAKNLAYEIIPDREFLKTHGFILNFLEGVIHTHHDPIEMTEQQEYDSFDKDIGNQLQRTLRALYIKVKPFHTKTFILVMI